MHYLLDENKNFADIDPGTANANTKIVMIDSSNNPITITISQLASLLGITGVGGSLKFTGNSIDVATLSTDTLNNKVIGRPNASNMRDYIPFVRGDDEGMEIGQMIDFHTKGSDSDFDYRLTNTGSAKLEGSGELTASAVWKAVAN